MKMVRVIHTAVVILGILYFIKGLYAFKNNKSSIDESDFYFDDSTDSSNKSSLLMGNIGNLQKRRFHQSAWSQEVEETDEKNGKRKLSENLDTGQRPPDISTWDFKKLLQYLVSVLSILHSDKDNHGGNYHKNKHEKETVRYNKTQESQTENNSSQKSRTDMINSAELETPLGKNESDQYKDHGHVLEYNESSKTKFYKERPRYENKNTNIKNSTLSREEASDMSKPTVNEFTNNGNISREKGMPKPKGEKLDSTLMPHINKSDDVIHRTHIQKTIDENSFTEEYVPIHPKNNTYNRNISTTTVLPTVKNFSVQSNNNESSPKGSNLEIAYKQEINKQTRESLPEEFTDNVSLTTKVYMEHKNIFTPQIKENSNVKKLDFEESYKISNEDDNITNSTLYDHALEAMDSDDNSENTPILDEEKSSEEINPTSMIKTINLSDNSNLKKHSYGTTIYELENEDNESKDDKEQNTESSNYSKQPISEDISYEDYCECDEYYVDEESHDDVERRDVKELLDLIDYVEEVMRNTTGDPKNTPDIPTSTTEVLQHRDFSKNPTDIQQNTTDVSQNIRYKLWNKMDIPHTTTSFPRKDTHISRDKMDIIQNTTGIPRNITDVQQNTSKITSSPLMLPLISRNQTKNTENIKPQRMFDTMLEYIYNMPNIPPWFKALKEERKTERNIPMRHI